MTYGWFIEGFDTVDLREGRALIGPLPNAHVIGANTARVLHKIPGENILDISIVICHDK